MTKEGQNHINKSRAIIQATAQYTSAYSLAGCEQRSSSDLGKLTLSRARQTPKSY